MNKLLYILLIIILSFGCTQKKSDKNNFNPSIDSLSFFLEKANDYDLEVPKRKLYTKKAFELVMNQENDSIHRVNLFRVANRYFNMDNWIEYKKVVDIALNKAILAKDSLSTAKGYS